MNFFLRILFVMAISLLGSQVWASYIYERDFASLGRVYLNRIGGLSNDTLERQGPARKDRCSYRYGRILNDGRIDIRILIGYFDWTTGSRIYKDGGNYGYSPSIDLGAFSALRKIITGRCPGRAEFCGFSQVPGSPYRFTKTIVIQGRRYPASVEIYFPSVSEYLYANIGKYLDEQKRRSRATLEQFRSALKSADAVFYLGHSRNGGGPDFDPPVFIGGTNKVNYNGYYKRNRPGLKNMLAALQAGGRQPAVLGLMSCDSRDHFLASVRRVAPRTGVISSLNVLTVDGVYTAMIGGADALLRGQCQSGFMNSIRYTSFNQKYITMDGMFE